MSNEDRPIIHPKMVAHQRILEKYLSLAGVRFRKRVGADKSVVKEDGVHCGNNARAPAAYFPA